MEKYIFLNEKHGMRFYEHGNFYTIQSSWSGRCEQYELVHKDEYDDEP